MIKRILLASMLASSLAGISVPAAADVVVRVAPPAPRVEAVPAPRRGYMWVPGHWDWRGNRHVWVRGTWLRERHGYRYNQPAWEERDGRWHMNRGGWARGDRDRDGVPNRVDRDRDGDGVPNRLDSNPNNPRRN
ncbi:hypothetical protein BH11PSE11_BH11PSE11_25780 [soil metagenome]